MPKNKDALFPLIIVSIILLGVYLRVLGYHNPSFWLDEAWRANIVSAPNWFEELLGNKRAPNGLGYISINVLLSRLHNSETVLRLSSLVPSILSILLVFLIAKNLFKTKLIIALASFSMAINPDLINYAKELKPFSLEILCHLTVIYFFILYWKSEKDKYLSMTFLAGFCSALVAANTVFLFPGIFLLLLNKYLREGDKKMLLIMSLVALSLLCTFILQYVFIWSNSRHDLLVKHWRHNFYLERPLAVDHLKWLCGQFLSSLRHFLNSNTFFGIPFLNTAYGIILPIFYFVGIVVLIMKRKADWLTLFLSPILILLIFNLLNIWPFGPIYVNIFIVIYLSMVTMFGLDYLVEAIKDKMRVALISWIVLFFFVFQFPFDFRLYQKKLILEEMKGAMAYIYDTYESNRGERDQENRVDGSKDTLCLSWLASPAFRYYTQYHHDFSKKYGDFFKNNFHIIRYKGRESSYVKEKSKEILAKNNNTWFLFSHFRTYEVNALREAVGTEKKDFPGAMVFYVASEKRM